MFKRLQVYDASASLKQIQLTGTLSAIKSSQSAGDWIKLIMLGLQPLAYQLILQSKGRYFRNSAFWETQSSQFTPISFRNVRAAAGLWLSRWNWAGNRSTDQIMTHISQLQCKYRNIINKLLIHKPSGCFLTNHICNALVSFGFSPENICFFIIIFLIRVFNLWAMNFHVLMMDN